MGLEPAGEGYQLGVRRREGELESLRCDAVVNAAGLVAERVAQKPASRLNARLQARLRTIELAAA